MEEMAKHAASESGWVAGMFAVLVAGGFGALGLIVRQLWSDHRELNGFVRTSLSDALSKNSRALNRVSGLLKVRPCLLPDEEQIDDLDSGEVA